MLFCKGLLGRRAFAACAAALGLALWWGYAAGAAPFGRASVRVAQSGREAWLSVEIARSPRARAQGLSGRAHLAENAGMLFVFPDAARRFFWMKDTRIPLSLAFIDGGGRIVEIVRLPPHVPGGRIASHLSRHKASRVLEVNRGWFLRNGLGVGARVFVE